MICDAKLSNAEGSCKAQRRQKHTLQVTSVRPNTHDHIHYFFFSSFGPDQDELAYPAHHMVLETTSRNQDSELSSSTMIPQMTAQPRFQLSYSSLRVRSAHDHIHYTTDASAPAQSRVTLGKDVRLMCSNRKYLHCIAKEWAGCRRRDQSLQHLPLLGQEVIEL